MRFIVIALSVLFYTSLVPLSEANAKEKNICSSYKKTSADYYKCKAKQAGGWFKKKAKGTGKKIGESKPVKSFKKFKERKKDINGINVD